MRNENNTKAKKKMMKYNISLKEPTKVPRSVMTPYVSLSLKKDYSKEHHLFGPINKNLFQLEQNVEFFSFAIKEIKEIIKQ